MSMTIDKTQTDAIIDELLGNNDLTASPEVWYGLHQIKKLPVTEIVRCGECKYLRRWISTNHQFCDITACKVSEDEFCNRAERRTDG